MNVNEHQVYRLMARYPAEAANYLTLSHARYAAEQALADGIITRQDFEELIGFIINKMYKEDVHGSH